MVANAFPVVNGGRGQVWYRGRAVPLMLFLGLDSSIHIGLFVNVVYNI